MNCAGSANMPAPTETSLHVPILHVRGYLGYEDADYQGVEVIRVGMFIQSIGLSRVFSAIAILTLVTCVHIRTPYKPMLA